METTIRARINKDPELNRSLEKANNAAVKARAAGIAPLPVQILGGHLRESDEIYAAVKDFLDSYRVFNDILREAKDLVASVHKHKSSIEALERLIDNFARDLGITESPSPFLEAPLDKGYIDNSKTRLNKMLLKIQMIEDRFLDKMRLKVQMIEDRLERNTPENQSKATLRRVGGDRLEGNTPENQSKATLRRVGGDRLEGNTPKATLREYGNTLDRNTTRLFAEAMHAEGAILKQLEQELKPHPAFQ